MAVAVMKLFYIHYIIKQVGKLVVLGVTVLTLNEGKYKCEMGNKEEFCGLD